MTPDLAVHFALLYANSAELIRRAVERGAPDDLLAGYLALWQIDARRLMALGHVERVWRDWLGFMVERESVRTLTPPWRL